MEQLSYIKTAEQFFESVGILVNKELDNLQSPTTVLATVIEQDTAEKNKYYVSYAGMKFYAYTEVDNGKTYGKNSQVYVFIPNGDYTEKKLIIGNYTNSDNTINYLSNQAFQDFVKAIEIKRQRVVFSKTPGSPPTSNIQVTTTATQTQKYVATPYDYIGITLTPIKNTKLSVSDFFSLDFTPIDVEQQLPEPIQITNRNLRGNTLQWSTIVSYDFIFPYPKEFSQMELELNTESLGTNVQWTGEESGGFDIQIWYGYSKDNAIINSEKLEIYSDIDLLTEKSYNPKDFRNVNLYLEAYGPNNNIVNCYQDEEVLGVALYRYKIGAVNSGAGANWELLEEYQKEASTYSLYRSTHTIFPGGTDAPLELCLDDSVFFFEAERTRFKICVTIPGKEPNSTLQLTSKELVFENSQVDNMHKQVVGQKIALHLKDGDDGVYNVYGLDNNLKSRANINDLYIKVSLADTGESLLSEDGSTYNTNLGVRLINWTYPTQLTGIEPVFSEGSSTQLKGAMPNGQHGDTFYYNLKPRCFNTYINNKITCTVYFTDGSYYTEHMELSLGGYNTQNSNYNLNIKFANGQKYINKQVDIKLEATLERLDGEAIELDVSNWRWSFVADTKSSCKYYDGSVDGAFELVGSTAVTVKYIDDIPIIQHNAVVKLSVDVTAGAGMVGEGEDQEYASQTQTLVAYLPIPYGDGNALTYMYIGPERIVYDNINDCSYDTTPIGLYNEKGEQVTITGLKLNGHVPYAFGIENNFVNYGHYLMFNDSGDKATYNSVKLMPKYGSTINTEAQVDILTIYTSGRVDDSPLWVQPILTYRNVWQNDFQGWRGNSIWQNATSAQSLNTRGIYSPFIAAGSADANNRFTGVMLGSVQVGNNPQPLYGLFGTREGNPRFYLTEQGEFYVGDEKHYIHLDQSSNLSIKLQRFNLTTYEKDPEDENKIREAGCVRVNDLGELEIKMEKSFLITTPNLVIDSNNEYIQFNTLPAGSTTTVRRVRIGKIVKKEANAEAGTPEEFVHGMDIYEGALRLYTKDDSTSPVLWVENSKLFFNGSISDKPTSAGGEPNQWLNIDSALSGIYPKGIGYYFKHDNQDIRMFNIKPYHSDTANGIGTLITVPTAFKITLGTKDCIYCINNTQACNLLMNMWQADKIYQNTTSGGLKRYQPVWTGGWAIGTSNISYMVAAGGTSNPYIHVETNIGNGYWNHNRGITTWTSDQRLKTNIQSSYVSGIQLIERLNHVSFNWKEDNKFVPLGFIAQEVEQLLPEAILSVPQPNGDELKQIKEYALIPYITKALQELNDTIKILKQEIKELQNNEND